MARTLADARGEDWQGLTRTANRRFEGGAEDAEEEGRGGRLPRLSQRRGGRGGRGEEEEGRIFTTNHTDGHERTRTEEGGRGWEFICPFKFPIIC